MAVGGDILELSYNHPTLGSGTIFAKSAEDSNFDLGGFRNDDDANGIDGGGTVIKKLNRVRWSFDVSVSWDMNNRNELEAVVAMAGDPQEAEWTISHINGTVYKGTGSPVGDLVGNGNSATFPLKLGGGGKLVKIS